MFIIGITGPTGAGKTSALRAVESLGALALDCDEIYRMLLEGCGDMQSEIDARFEGVLVGGDIDRARLREIVFNDSGALRDLNAITHKYVKRERDRKVEDWRAQGGTLAAVDAIALIESGAAGGCDVVVGVIAPVDRRIERIVTRDGITHDAARQRVAAQKTDDFYRQHCDYLLENVYNTPDEFEVECKVFFEKLIGGHRR